MANKAYSWFKPLARAGYFSRGVVYLIIGGLAIFAGFGGGSTTGTKGALEKLMSQPFGSGLLWLLVIGLVGYVLWRGVQALFDTDDHGLGPKGLAVRAGLFASAFTYSTLALYALSMLGVFNRGSESGSGGGGNPVAEFISQFVANRYVSLGLCIIFVIVMGSHWWKAYKRKYADHIEAEDRYMPFIHGVAITGLIARGFVFAIISLLLFYRFLSADKETSERPGIHAALDFVHTLPAGNVLLMIMGLGIVFFAAYSFAEARWRKVNVQDAT